VVLQRMDIAGLPEADDSGTDNYNPPKGWWPGRHTVGTEAHDRYDQAFNLHHRDREEYKQCIVLFAAPNWRLAL